MNDFNLSHNFRGAGFRARAGFPATILTHIKRQASKRATAPFMTFVTFRGEVDILTYRGLDEGARRTATWIRHDLGVSPGQVVGLLPFHDAPSVLALFGILRSGCTALILNPNDPSGRLLQQMEAAGARTVLGSPALANVSYPAVIPISFDRRARSRTPTEPRIQADSVALLFATSGSTAASKLVAQTHYNIVANAEAVRRHHGLKAGDRILGCLPMHHVNCVHFTIFGTLAVGAHTVLAQGFDAFGYPGLLRRYEPRIASVVPSILEALLAAWRDPEMPQGFDYFVSAAAPLQQRTARAVIEKFGVRVLQGYGLTETTNFSTTLPRDLGEEEYRETMLDTDIPSVGTPIHGNELTVLGENGEAVRDGEPGEICMRGHNVMLGYAGNAAETAKAFRGGWFHSGDLGFRKTFPWRREAYFVLTGRLKNIAKVGGESVSLEEMDRVLGSMTGISDAACTCLPDRLLGERVFAAVVSNSDIDQAALRRELSNTFAAAVLPTHIVRVAIIPRTATGKLMRRELALILEGIHSEHLRERGMRDPTD